MRLPKGSEGKHDSLIDVVESELRSRGYTDIFRNTNYSYKDCGEIDLYAVKNNYVLLFEMKSNDTYKARKKAISQLSRATNNCFNNYRVFKFYVSNYKEPQIEWIRRN